MGKLTALSIEKKISFQDIKLDEYKSLSNEFDETVFELFDIESALSSRTAIGAPSPKNVANQISQWKKKLSE